MRECNYDEMVREIGDYIITDISFKCLFKQGRRIRRYVETLDDIPKSGILEVLFTEDINTIHYAITYPDKYIELEIIK